MLLHLLASFAAYRNTQSLLVGSPVRVVAGSIRSGVGCTMFSNEDTEEVDISLDHGSQVRISTGEVVHN